MKKIVVILVVLSLNTIMLQAQLAVITALSQSDTTLYVSLKSTHNKNIMLRSEYQMNDDGSYFEVSFLDGNNTILKKERYGFILNHSPRMFLLIPSQKKLDFVYNFAYLNKKAFLNKTKKISIYFHINYFLEGGEKPSYKDFSKEFVIE